MVTTRTEHDTIRIHRRFDAAVGRVFAAWKDTAALERWCCPGDHGWSGRIKEHDFCVGGRKVMVFGPVGAPPYTEDSRYLDIVPDERIIVSETIVNDGRRISASLITLEFAEDHGATALTITDQIAALDGADSADARRGGWEEVLDKLSAELSAAPV